MPLRVIWAESDDELNVGGDTCLSIVEAAAKIGISVKTLLRHIDREDITPLPERIGTLVLFLEKDVDHIKGLRSKRGY